MIDPGLRKEIVRNLRSAIDSELLDHDEEAYYFYVDSLSLVADALKQDRGTATLSVKDKWNLIEFARESVSRVSVLLNKGEPPPRVERDEQHPSAPPESISDQDSVAELSLKERLFPSEAYNTGEEMLMCRYQRRLSIATSALEKQNLELELARKLVENAAITRNKLMMSSAWAMQSADKKFRIQEKLQSGCLKGTDIQKQQLYALSLQSNQGNSLLTRLELDLTLFPSNENVARELLNVVLTDSAHPVNAALNHMQHRVDQLLKSLMTESGATDGYTSGRIDAVAQVIKDDLNVLQDVLTATFDPLNSDRNSSITSEVVNHVYLSKLKTNIVSLLRVEMTEEEVRLSNKMRESSEIFCHLPENVEREAKNKLHYLTTLHNPYEMLDCTVHIVKLLATCKFDHEHSTSMGADDLLPRLCQILINSALPEINAEAAFMEIFMPAEKALGEEGYALTTLQSAIAHLSSLPNNDH